jgi:hypothetical protein
MKISSFSTSYSNRKSMVIGQKAGNTNLSYQRCALPRLKVLFMFCTGMRRENNTKT